MKAVPTIIATTAALVVGGGLFAVQASADPTTPAPRPPDTGTTAGKSGGQDVGWFFTELTDVQRSCLADAGLRRPAGKLTPESAKELRSAVDAALEKCEVKVPARLAGRDKLGFRWAALSTEQQQCLADVSLTRPVGRLTPEQRAALRQSKLDAIKGCGIGS
jgi:Spy/CpxP family protein refolding chaperone